MRPIHAISGIVLPLAVLVLAGCTAPLNSLDTAHCHAEHNAILDTHGDPWAYLKGAPGEDFGRVYTWGLQRTGGCVSDVHLQLHSQLDTDTPACGGVSLETSVIAINVTLAGKDRPGDVPGASPGQGALQWFYDQRVSYDPNVETAEPQSWNMTVRLVVSHDPLALAEHVDDCVHRAVRLMEARGTDRDFKV